MKLIAIVTPPEPAARFAASTSRKYNKVDGFAAALSHLAGVPVPIIEGSLADAPDEGLLIDFDGYGLAKQPELGPRVVLMNADRAYVLDVVEKYHLAAAIEKYRYFQWRRQRDRERGDGVFGRIDVAEKINIAGVGYKDTEHYRLLGSMRYPDLPSLLVAYLRAYEEMQLLIASLAGQKSEDRNGLRKNTASPGSPAGVAPCSASTITPSWPHPRTGEGW